MTIAADKPAYIPAISYFYKMKRADMFVLADDILYRPQSAANRTAVKGTAGKQWLTVPVLSKGRGRQRIKDVQIDPIRHWRRKHWKALSACYQYTPYF